MAAAAVFIVLPIPVEMVVVLLQRRKEVQHLDLLKFNHL